MAAQVSVPIGVNKVSTKLAGWLASIFYSCHASIKFQFSFLAANQCRAIGNFKCWTAVGSRFIGFGKFVHGWPEIMPAGSPVQRQPKHFSSGVLASLVLISTSVRGLSALCTFQAASHNKAQVGTPPSAAPHS